MDSWVYPALDRLAALGFVPSQSAGLRPWSRRECRRQVLEAERVFRAREDVEAAVASEILATLRTEFPVEGDAALTLESVYMRAGAIAGPALNDSFHFGQTWQDDFGRPFGRGMDSILGFTARAEHGRYFAWVRGEYQRAPGRDAYSDSVQRVIAKLDRKAVSTGALPDVSRPRWLEGYLGARLGALTVSFGKQELYWGPGAESPLSFSANAEPTHNLKISSDPFRFGGFLSHLGTVRAEFVAGKLGGHSETWRPWFNAQKVSFKVSDDLEFGFTRWSLIFGVGHPITLRNVARNFFFLGSTNSEPFDPNDPGDRKGGFDFRVRVPGVRNWLTLYSDSYADDDPSPLAAPRRAAWSPGVWLTRVPWIPKLDFRVEAAATRTFDEDHGGQYVYYNNQYKSGNTNYGYLVGDPVGRDSRAITARSTYWLSVREKLEARFEQRKLGCAYLEGGGTDSRGTVSSVVRLGDQWHASLEVQYQRFWIPVVGGPRHNWGSRLGLVWEPIREGK
jgi:hypothetical protein